MALAATRLIAMLKAIGHLVTSQNLVVSARDGRRKIIHIKPRKILRGRLSQAGMRYQREFVACIFAARDSISMREANWAVFVDERLGSEG